jgi:hypothetical protein
VCGGVLLHVRGKKFQSDLAMKRRVVGQKHFSHPSLADFFDDPVVRYGLADHGECLHYQLAHSECVAIIVCRRSLGQLYPQHLCRDLWRTNESIVLIRRYRMLEFCGEGRLRTSHPRVFLPPQAAGPAGMVLLLY